MKQENEIDVSLYSRQIKVYGYDMQTKMSKMKVLIIGLRGTGAELSKDLALSGIGEIGLYDPYPIEPRDLGANFLIEESEVNKVSRSEGCIKKLQEINQYVKIRVVNNPNIEEEVNNYDVVVITELIVPYEKIAKIAELCRTKALPTGFIIALSFGLLSVVFLDFGAEFKTLHTRIGEHKYFVDHITNGNPGIVNISGEDKEYILENTDKVVFSEVQGMTELNSKGAVDINDYGEDPIHFTIGDTTKLGKYTGGGIVTCVDPGVVRKFKPFPFALESTDSIFFHNFSNNKQQIQLHIAFKTLMQYFSKNKSLPRLNSIEDAEKYVELCKTLNPQIKENTLDLDFQKNVALYAAAEVAPVVSITGALGAQEVMKFTGWFSPIHQIFYHDFYEYFLPVMNAKSKTVEGRSESRYSDFIALFGVDALQKIADMNLFVAGAGAIGSELLKNLALLGVSSRKGILTCADADNIELSNLNRQLLFRRKDIGNPKSLTACNAVNKINKEVKCISHNIYVKEENEKVLTDEFYEQTDVFFSAIDNKEGRMYVTDKALWHKKPCLDAGTGGMLCNTYIFLPEVSECYEKSINQKSDPDKFCSIREFPCKIEHTIDWAKKEFSDFFTFLPNFVNEILRNPEESLQKQMHLQGCYSKERLLPELKNLLFALKVKNTQDISECIKFVLEYFKETYFTYPQGQIEKHPKDSIENGLPFWGSERRFPAPLDFNRDDKLHYNFVETFVRLLAESFEVKFDLDEEKFKILMDNTLKTLSAAPPSIHKEIDFQEIFSQIKDLIMKLNQSAIKLINYDKDCEHHTIFVFCLANLKARLYNIPECDLVKVKMLTGIEAAISTSTAFVAGFEIVDFLKIALDPKLTTPLKSTFANLSRGMFFRTLLPQSCEIQTKEIAIKTHRKAVAIIEKSNSWTIIEIDKNKAPTINSLIRYLEDQYKFPIMTIKVQGKYVFNPEEKDSGEISVENFAKMSEESIKKDKKKFLRLEVIGYDRKNRTFGIFPKFKYKLN